MKASTRSILFCCCLLAACSETGPPTRGQPVAFDAVCDKSNEGRRVMLEGYLAFPENFTYRGNQDTIILRLRPALESPLAVGAGAHIGNGSNSVELPPKSYRSDDLRVHTADGQVFGYRDKVRVSGTMYYPGSMAKVEFKCGLTNSLYESVSRP